MCNILLNRLLPKIQSDGSDSCSNENYDACMYKTLKMHMLKSTSGENGCTTPWILHTTKICKKSENVISACLVDYKRGKNQFKDCELPCETLKVSLGDKDSPKNSKGINLELYFPPRVLLTEEKYYYTFHNLVAEIGGLIGLVRNIFWIVMLLLGYLLKVYNSRPNLNKNH